jgi:hypothetical protein
MLLLCSRPGGASAIDLGMIFWHSVDSGANQELIWKTGEIKLMKSNKLMLVWVAVLAVGLLGCGKSGESVNPAPLENNFASAEPAAKSSADKAVSAIKASDYPAALVELKTLASNAKLTPAQKQAVDDVLAQIQKAVAGAATKAQGDATKAADDLKKSLPK